MIPFPGSLSQRDYGNHHVVPAASHPFIAKHARAGRDAQNGLGGVPDFKPGSQSDLLLLVALNRSLFQYSLDQHSECMEKQSFLSN